MAGIKPSVVVSEILGKAGSVVFSKWKGRAYVRSLVTPANPQSNDQTFMRGYLRKVVAWWHDIPVVVQDACKAVAAFTDVTGFNLFTQRNAEDLSYAPGTWPDPPATRADPIARIMPLSSPVNPVDSVVATAQVNAGEITVTWDQGAAVTGDLIYILAELHATLFDESAIFKATHAAATVQTETVVITGLTPGASYDLYVMVRNAATEGYSIARPVKQSAHA